MHAKILIAGVLLQFTGVTQSLVIPDELPSLLSVVYSNIPTIKKGTDSRLGWGFRLGNRADFQVLVELGPQTNTQPLANQGDDASSNKRDAPHSLKDLLYAQRQKDKKQYISNTDGGKWLDQWRQNVEHAKRQQNSGDLPSGGIRSGLGVGEIDAKSVIPDDSVTALEQLYGKREKGNEKGAVADTKTTTPKPKTTTSSKEALDNVDMDDE